MASTTRAPRGQLVDPGRHDRPGHVHDEGAGRGGGAGRARGGRAGEGQRHLGRRRCRPQQPERTRHRDGTTIPTPSRMRAGVLPVASARSSIRSRQVRGGGGRRRAPSASSTADRRGRARSLPGRGRAASGGRTPSIVVSAPDRSIRRQSERGPPSPPRSRGGHGGRPPSAGSAASATARRRRGTGRPNPATPSTPPLATCTSSCRSSRSDPTADSRRKMNRPRVVADAPGAAHRGDHEHGAASSLDRACRSHVQNSRAVSCLR